MESGKVEKWPQDVRMAWAPSRTKFRFLWPRALAPALLFGDGEVGLTKAQPKYRDISDTVDGRNPGLTS